MKREIKFRGRLKRTKKWMYGDLAHIKGQPCIQVDVSVEDRRTLVLNVEPDSVGQFTGLHDKNGREIYEGDILRGDCYPFHDDGEDNYLGVVFYADEDHMWEVMKFVTAKSKRGGISNFVNDEFYETDFSQMEVVGNLWDNKGLFRDSDEDIMKWFNGD